MPTGYTDQITDTMQLGEFALICARAFGATVEMRDEPLNAPIPEAFAPSTYSADRIAEARTTLASLLAMSEVQAAAKAIEEHREAVESNRRYVAKQAATQARYQRMLDMVQAWTAPTPGHEGLRAFMLEQLTESIRFDCGYEPDTPELLDGRAWLDKAIAKANSDIAYHEANHAKEVERAKNRTEWVQALRRSVSVAAVG
jgi:hypothetical protein